MPKLNNFGDVFPPRNLGGASPWGRHVEARIEGLERKAEGTSGRVTNENRVLSSRAELQADQMKKLASQQEILDEQQQALHGQQQELHSQQSELSRVVREIPVSGSHSGQSNGYSIPSGTKDQITINIPVPEGKTRASVFAVGNAFFFSDSVPMAAIAVWRVQIQGTDGPLSNNVPLNMDGKSSSFSFARDFNVSEVSSISVKAQTIAGDTHPTYQENNAFLHVNATFSA